MYISNITPPQVWSSSSRSLTNFGSSALANTSAVNTSIPGAGSVDLRPSAGIIAHTAVGVFTGAAAAATIQIILWDGSNAIVMAQTAAAASSPIGFFMTNCNNVGTRLLNNDATHAGSYQHASMSMTI